MNLVGPSLELEYLLCGDDGGQDVGGMQCVGALEHFALFFQRRIANAQAYQEPVELGFRQWECPVVFCWILRGDHHERLFERMRLIVHRDLGFAHRFQEAALCFRRRAVDFVGQDDVGKDWSRHEFKCLLLPVEDGDANDIGWQQIAGELNALERAVERTG